MSVMNSHVTAYVYKGNSNYSMIASTNDGLFYVISMKDLAIEHKMDIEPKSFTEGSGYFDVIGGYFYLCLNNHHDNNVIINQYSIHDFSLRKKLKIPRSNINFNDNSMFVDGDILTVIASSGIVQISANVMKIVNQLPLDEICSATTSATLIDDKIIIGCTSVYNQPTFISVNYKQLEINQLVSYGFGFFPTCMIGMNNDKAILAGIVPFNTDLENIVLLLLDKELLTPISNITVPLKSVYPRIALTNHGNGALITFGNQVYLLEVGVGGNSVISNKNNINNNSSNNNDNNNNNSEINFKLDSVVNLSGYVTSGNLDRNRQRALILTSESKIYSIQIPGIKPSTGHENSHQGWTWWKITFLVMGLTFGLSMIVFFIKLIEAIKSKKQNKNNNNYIL